LVARWTIRLRDDQRGLDGAVECSADRSTTGTQYQRIEGVQRPACSRHCTNPFAESVVRLLADTVFETLSYFDGAVLAPRGRALALFSVGLMDRIVPPSCVYGAFNVYGGPKQMAEYHYSQHEGGGGAHLLRKLQFLEGVRNCS
jgi:hypothetical protein